MKNPFFTLMLLALFAFGAQAQVSVPNPADIMSGAAGLAPMLGALTKGIKPSALKPEFKDDKQDFLGKIATLDPTNAAGMGEAASSLLNGLDPSAFTGGWAGAKDQVMNALKDPGSVSNVASALSSVMDNLDPSIFKGKFGKNLAPFKDGLKAVAMAGI